MFQQGKWNILTTNTSPHILRHVFTKIEISIAFQRRGWSEFHKCWTLLTVIIFPYYRAPPLTRGRVSFPQSEILVVSPGTNY
jgi:hypothetical protein